MATTGKAASVAVQKPPGLTEASAAVARRWMVGLVVFGIAWRVLRWALGMPVWGDEAMIGLNIIERSYAELLKPLDDAQVSPVGFLWVERAAYEWLGMGERAMRLPALLASVGALVLFWRWSRLLVDAFAAASATGIMAVSVYVVRHGTELKPYAFDLLAALALLLPATHILLNGRQRWFAVLVLAAPLVLLSSYPAVFVAGGVFLALLVWATGRRSAAAWGGVGVYGAVVGACFLVVLELSAREQFDATASFMTAYWGDAFPPGHPLKFVTWFAERHAGNMFAYPAGGKNGASAGSLVLFVVGLLALRGRMPSAMSGSPRRIWFVLFLAPFALTFIAAAMHRYPYGGSARVAQHLAPVIILLMGMGISAAVQQLARTARGQRRAVWGICAAIAVVGLIGLGRNVVQPYKTRDDLRVRELIAQVGGMAKPEEPLVVLEEYEALWPNYQWYLHGVGEDRVMYDGVDHPAVLRGLAARDADGFWVLRLDADTPAVLSPEEVVEERSIGPELLEIGPREEAPAYFEAFFVARSRGTQRGASDAR